MADDLNIKKRKALVSGGGSGIGLSVAEKLAGEGCKTIVADKNISAASKHNDITFIDCDITKAENIEKLSEQATEPESPDILVCNAGQGIHEKLSEGDPEKWSQIIDLNVMGALRLIRAFVPEMVRRGFGDIVFTSSVSAFRAYEYGGIYCATKAAIEKIAETLRLEVQNDNVRVTVVAPGVVDTAFFKNSISADHTAEDIGWGAVAPEEIAEMIFFAVTQKQGTALNYLTVRPTAQPL